MSDKHEDATLILKLYELRREEKMRQARNWYAAEFNPASVQDVMHTLAGEHSADFRMVTSYWDMAASLVNHDAINEEMFNDANGEHMLIFAKVEPFLAEMREKFGSPRAMHNLEQLVMRRPNAKEALAAMRERGKKMVEMRLQMEQQHSAAQSS